MEGVRVGVIPNACTILSTGTGEPDAVKVARTVLRGGKCRKAPTYPEQATANSLWCAAVVHTASPSQMGRMQRNILGSAAYLNPKGQGDTSLPTKPRTERRR